MFSKLILVITALIWYLPVCSQIIGNVRARIDGDKIILQYDLKASPKDSWVEVQAFSSQNSFSTPMSNVSGAIDKVTPGVNKQIEWLYGNELDNFDGDLSFELEAEVIFHLTFIVPKQGIRRGKETAVTWGGGRPQDSIHFELISPTKKVIWETIVLNKKRTLNIHPEADLALGKGYQMRLMSREEKVTIPVQIKKKVARFWLVSPMVVAAGTITYLLMPKPPEPLPFAPEPPNGN